MSVGKGYVPGGFRLASDAMAAARGGCPQENVGRLVASTNNRRPSWATCGGDLEQGRVSPPVRAR